MLYNIAKFILIFFVIFRRVKIEGRKISLKKARFYFCKSSKCLGHALNCSFYEKKSALHGKAELFKNPILGFIIRSLGAFPISRGKGDVDL